MGGFFSGSDKVKTCIIEAPMFKENLGKLIVLTDVIEKLAIAISSENITKNTMKKFPNEYTEDPASFLNSLDSLENNAVTRYHAFYTLADQIPAASRLDVAEERWQELLKYRENITTQIANLCV